MYLFTESPSFDSVTRVTKTEETEDDDFDYTQWEIESAMSDFSDHSSDTTEGPFLSCCNWFYKLAVNI